MMNYPLQPGDVGANLHISEKKMFLFCINASRFWSKPQIFTLQNFRDCFAELNVQDSKIISFLSDVAAMKNMAL